MAIAARVDFSSTNYSWYFAAWLIVPVGIFGLTLPTWASELIGQFRDARNADRREYFALVTPLQFEVDNGCRPGDLPAAEFDALSRLCRSKVPTYVAAQAQPLLYRHELDAGRFDNAAAVLDHSWRFIESLSRIRQPAVLFTLNFDLFDFAAIQAVLYPNGLDDPMGWLERAEGLTVVPRSTRLCAEAAVLLHVGRPQAALERVRHARMAHHRETVLADSLFVPGFLDQIELAARSQA